MGRQRVHPPPPTGGTSFYSHLNEEARAERAGNSAEIPDLVRGGFINAGIPLNIAEAFGFTGRVVQAQRNYRAGTQSAIHEADIVKAVNNFAAALGAPAWARTTPEEVRRLRVRLAVVIPQLFAYEGRPDAKGHYPLLSPNMSPVEASFIALTMLNMKAFNPDFQFTAAEQAQNRKLDPAVVQATLRQRQRWMSDVIQGRSSTISLRDVLAAGENLFTDLGIPRAAVSAQLTPPLAKALLTGAKGGL